MKFGPLPCFSKISICAVIAVCALGARAEEIEISGDITSATNYTISVANNATVVYSGKFTLTDGAKLIKMGKLGTLVLSNPQNAFAGGISVSEGTLRIDAADAQGAGPISVVAGGTARGLLLLNAEGMTLSNPVTVSGECSASYPAVLANLSATVESDIVGVYGLVVGNANACGRTTTFGNYDTQYTVWKGNLAAKDSSGKLKEFSLSSYGTNRIEGAVTCERFHTGNGSTYAGKIYLSNPSNRFTHIYSYYNGVECANTNVLGYGYQDMFRGTTGGYYLLGGYDQTLSYLTYTGTEASRIPGTTHKTAYFKSSSPATLTLTGGAANGRSVSYMAFYDNVSLLCDFTNPSYEQVLSNRTHTTTGSVRVKAGRLTLMGGATMKGIGELRVDADGVLTAAVTEINAFMSVTNLAVDGTLSLSQSAFGKGVELSVALGAGAELALADAETLVCGSLTVDGSPVKPGMYEAGSAAVPALRSGRIQVLAREQFDTWTGGGASASVTDGDNWLSGRPHDLTEENLSPTFAEGGASATVGAGAQLNSVTLAWSGAAGDGCFSFAGETDGASLLVNGAMAFAPDGTARWWRFLLPVEFLMDQSWTIPAGTTLEFDDDLTVGKPLAVDGQGTLKVLGPTTTFGDSARLKNGLVVLSGHITTADGRPFSGTPASGTTSGVLELSSPTVQETDVNVFSNVTIDCGLFLNKAVAGSYPITAAPGTTNIVRGGASIDGFNGSYSLLGKSELVFEGGLKSDYSQTLWGDGTSSFVIRGKPCQFSAFYPHRARFVLDAEGCQVSVISIGSVLGSVEYRRSFATSDTVVKLSATKSTGLYLNATTQGVAKVQCYEANIIEGRYPAMLYVTEGADEAEALASSYNINCNVRGGVGLGMSGDKLLLVTNRTFTTCGDIDVCNGRMRFAENAFWPKGTNVTVRGAGTLELTHKGTFGRHADLHVGDLEDGWKIALPDGIVAENFHRLYDADGRELPAGTYGGVDSPATCKELASHFTGTGVINVRGGGIVLIVR